MGVMRLEKMMRYDYYCNMNLIFLDFENDEKGFQDVSTYGIVRISRTKFI
jgi:hypothetical protein